MDLTLSMQRKPTRKTVSTGAGLSKAVLACALPLLLLLVFVGQQINAADIIGLSHGFTHPLTGWDHLVTMLAVGIWAAQLRGHAIWLLPLAFVSVMSLGGIAGAAGIALPSVEGIVLLSCAVFSVLITRQIRFSTHSNVMIVAFFAFFHGFAHGQEISASASLISYTLGFMVATLLLHGAGILVAKLVVLALSCLLTLLFSSAALAKAFEAKAEFSGQPVAQPLSAKVFAHGGGADYFAAGSSDVSDGGALSRGGTGSLQDSALKNQSGDGGPGGSHGKTPPGNPVYVLDCGNGESSSAGAFGRAEWFHGADRLAAGLTFKRFFPDINDTPGKRLRGSSVGKTSPPADSLHPLSPSVALFPTHSVQPNTPPQTGCGLPDRSNPPLACQFLSAPVASILFYPDFVSNREPTSLACRFGTERLRLFRLRTFGANFFTSYLRFNQENV